MTREFDGFYFLPGENDGELKIAYFKMNAAQSSAPIETTAIGDKFHIAFFKKNVDGMPVFDESFEAIFSDPSVYIENIIGQDLFGCVFRKTETSTKWWEDYLTKAKLSCAAS